MIFPFMFGHLTFASHRCWNVYIKKAIWLACDAWHRTYGESVLYAARKVGDGELLQHVRHGHKPYPMPGWKKIHVDGSEMYEGPKGQRCLTLSAAFDVVIAAEVAAGRSADAKSECSIMHQLLLDYAKSSDAKDVHVSVGCTASEQVQQGTAAGTHAFDVARYNRVTVTTTTIEDWLWRGDDPLVKHMSLYVYAMWMYRVEKSMHKESGVVAPRYVEVDFSCDYKLYHSHKQRVATEFRIDIRCLLVITTPNLQLCTSNC